MSTSDKASVITQGVLTLGVVAIAGRAAGIESGSAEVPELGNEAHSATNLLNLNKSLASAEQMGENGEAIMGAGTNKTLDSANRLANQYGGDSTDWSKTTSSNYQASDGSMVETHWYQNDAINSGKIEPKTKINPN
jgi:hypothetical protein